MKYILELSETLTQIVYPDYDQIVLIWEADDGIHTRVCTTKEMAKLVADGKVVSATRATPSDLPPPPPVSKTNGATAAEERQAPMTGGSAQQRVVRRKNEHIVRTLLREAGKPVPITEVMRVTGLSNGTVRAYLWRHRHDFENVEKGLWKFVGSDA